MIKKNIKRFDKKDDKRNDKKNGEKHQKKAWCLTTVAKHSTSGAEEEESLWWGNIFGAVVGLKWLDPGPCRYRDFASKFPKIEFLNLFGSLSKIWLKYKKKKNFK